MKKPNTKDNKKEDYNSIRHLPHGSSPKELSQCWDAFFKAISKGKTKYGFVIDTAHDGWYPPHQAAILTSIEHKDVEALGQLYTDLKRAFRAYGERRYNEGVEEGKNLLIGLNKGTISLKDFEDQ